MAERPLFDGPLRRVAEMRSRQGDQTVEKYIMDTARSESHTT